MPQPDTVHSALLSIPVRIEEHLMFPGVGHGPVAAWLSGNGWVWDGVVDEAEVWRHTSALQRASTIREVLLIPRRDLEAGSWLCPAALNVMGRAAQRSPLRVLAEVLGLVGEAA